MKKLPKLVVILGPTASGKTKLAIELARRFNGEIISADSRQLYTGMDIGTGKDLGDYGKGKNAVKYHLIDVAAPTEQFDLKRYQEAAYKAIDGVLGAKKTPILVGGSGLYLQAVVDGYRLSTAQKPAQTPRGPLTLAELSKELGPKFMAKLNDSDKKNPRRLQRYLEIMKQSASAHENFHRPSSPRYDCLVIGIDLSIETIRKNIQKRLESRFEEGMIEELKRLHAKGVSWKKFEAFGLEYKYIALYLQKKLGKADMQEKLRLAIGQFAKRQMTWFRRWEKQGREISWVKPNEIKKIAGLVSEFI